ncbi:MAG: DUF456 domain-containing protein [Tannerella sp.]|jgi:uncharacterized protein YqgC (DUF456 family)|nr:DUF456 domain-containing protein [Tannerella sp.]
MTLDIILIILAFICLILGLIGSVAPVLPGPPLSYSGLLLLHLTDRVQFTTSQLIWWLVITLIAVAADYLIPILGVKKWHGSKWGRWGCFIGIMVGCIFFMPWGIILGPFIGTVIGEALFEKKQMSDAIKVGFGSFIGFLFGAFLKFAVCLWFFYCFIHALIQAFF